ncbi:hypothetical protein QTO04_25670, partial [Vibrio parahaemolyticus]
MEENMNVWAQSVELEINEELTFSDVEADFASAWGSSDELLNEYAEDEKQSLADVVVETASQIDSEALKAWTEPKKKGQRRIGTKFYDRPIIGFDTEFELSK